MDFKRYEPENFNAILPHENGRFMLVADHKAAMRDQDDHSKAMATDYEKQIAALKDTWKCFHCGFETTSRKEAEAHFGDGEGEPTMCIFWLTMPDHERVHAYQELSVELENERADIQRQAKEIKRYREALEKIEQRANERHSGERERDVVYAMYYLATNALKTKTEV